MLSGGEWAYSGGRLEELTETNLEAQKLKVVQSHGSTRSSQTNRRAWALGR